MLNALQEKGSVPVFPQKANFVPGMGTSGKHVFTPRLGRRNDVIFDLNASLLLILGSENGVAEADLNSRTSDEWDISVV